MNKPANKTLMAGLEVAARGFGDVTPVDAALDKSNQGIILAKYKRLARHEKRLKDHPIRSRIPGTRLFRERFARDAIAATNWNLYLALTQKWSLEIPRSRLAHSRLRRELHKVACSDTRHRYLLAVVEKGLGWFLLLTTTLSAPFIVTTIANRSLPHGAFLLTFLAAIVALRGSGGAYELIRKSALQRGALYLGVLWPLLASSFSLWTLMHAFRAPGISLSSYGILLDALILACTVISPVVFLIFLGGVICVVLQEERTKRIRHPLAAILDVALVLLRRCEKAAFRDLSRRESKRAFIDGLERMARIAESLPFSVAAKDPNVRAWIYERSSSFAAGFRERKKWVLTPKTDTHDRLVEYLRVVAHGAAAGNWDEIPTAAVTRGLRPRYQRAWVIIRSVIAIAVPIAGIVLSFWRPSGVPALFYSPAAILIYFMFGAAIQPNALRIAQDVVSVTEKIGLKDLKQQIM